MSKREKDLDHEGSEKKVEQRNKISSQTTIPGTGTLYE